MRIQHNIAAMNAYRNYNNNVKSVNSNLEKLSSGYKINRAGDDAAGLAISEKMRAQITGLDAAQKNVKDGVSLVKTAEGAMQEIQDMLNRMDYLATQSANGTYDNEVDRANLQKEVSALKSEINRIADSANFNGIKLLDGSIAQRNAGSKTVNATGMDRIIKSTLSPGEDSNSVTGMKTILEEVGDPNGAAGSFSVRLQDLKLDFTGFSSATATGTVSIKINIGGTDITMKATGVTATTSYTDILGNLFIATDVMGSVATSSTASTGFLHFGSSDMDWYVTQGSGSSITFTMKEPPKNASQAKTNFDVKVTAADDKTSVGGNTDVGVYTNTKAMIKGGGHSANTVFSINENDIVDGAKITLGTTTIVLAVGATSKYATASNAADLTAMNPDKIDLNTALQAISNAFGPTINAVGKDSNGVEGTTVFNVGVNDGSNGGPVGITIQGAQTPSTASEVRFDTLEKLAGIFSIETTRTWAKSDGLTLQIGDTADSFNQLSVSVGDMHTDAMGSGKDVNGNDSSKTIAEIDISTQAGAAEAVQIVKNAINYVSSVRGDLGAVQNRLEHTQNNLSVMAENIQDAESTIRDTDVADEMMKYVKNNILVQSAQAMLAQANQLPQGVLQLLG